MRNNPFKSKVSLLEPNYPFRTSRSSNPKQKQQFRNPFQRKFLIPETKNHSNKKESKSKSLYSEKLSQRSPFNQSIHLLNQNDYHQYRNIFIVEEGFRRQKTLQLQRKYSQIFGYQVLRYQYAGNTKNKQYFDQKIQSNNSQKTSKTSKTNKLFKQSCQAYADKGIVYTQLRNLKEQKKAQKSTQKGKTKKMLSWNIQNERDEIKEKRKISHKQFLLKQSNQSSFLGILSKNAEKTPIQGNKQELKQEAIQDYVLQVSKSERLSNKMSSSLLFSRQNFNNLNYGSNFQWLSYQKPSHFNEAQEERKKDNNFPEQISFEGKKFDLLRF